ncbi:MAG: hypothetical protein FRX48_08128 [Lasallia pustulata]|uniref:Uncharacterized protein n=1 Tax=Lasallia pustulata TaxID=136370 RepID=A0A5M8PHQ9_9LECA|nr:MAG: hypothetical protein FRX48_08128 [Lasallia pustulata]
MDFELDEPTMDSNYDDYYNTSEGGEPPPAAPPEDSEGRPVVKVEDLEEHKVKEGDVEEHRVKRKHMTVFRNPPPPPTFFGGLPGGPPNAKALTEVAEGGGKQIHRKSSLNLQHEFQ